MAGITYAQASAKLSVWLDAEEKIILGQSVSFDGRSLTRADLDKVRKSITYWDQRCKELSRGSRVSVQRAIIHD